MSGTIRGGWPLGNINTMPGASAAGKTIEVLTLFSEAAIDKRFNSYKLIYDDVERRCDFNMKKLFEPLLPRLITPSGKFYKDLKGKEDESGISDTIQDLRNTMLRLKKDGEPFIYVADSLDSFTTNEELEKEMRRMLAAAKSKEAADKIAGSFNAEKAKILGQILRMINGVVKETNSMFLLTQQLRQRMKCLPGQSPWVTSGGEAPYYYSQIRAFLIKKTVHKDRKRKIGVRTLCRMDKNSVTGKLRDVEFDIYSDIGIDDTGSMVAFLLSEGHWKSGSWITVKELGLKENGRTALIERIEKEDLEGEVRKIVTRVWQDIEDSIDMSKKRKSKYGC